MSNRVIIIGGGIAAINAIKAIREVDSEIDIYLFQNEKFYPYNRIRLTKSLFDNLEEEKILLQKKEWYRLNKVNLYLNKNVIEIDTNKEEVILDDGSRFSYDKLLLANGSSNFVPPIDGINKREVYTIRKLNDIQNIKDSIDNKKVILNIGGGIQGLEIAWILHQHGKNVIIAEVQQRLMPRQLDARASSILQKAIEGFKIELLLNTQVKSIVGKEAVKGVITKSDNKVDCDMVIYAVGIRANIELLKNTPIKTNIGVIVNDKMETNIENIYAAGDVAEFNGRVNGLWNIAIEQGKTAGYNMVGKNVAYSKIVPVTTMNAFNISLFSMGNVDEQYCTQALVDEASDGLSYKRIFIKDNKIIGAIVIGDIKNSPILKSAIEREIMIKELDLSSMSVNDLLAKLKK